MRLKSTLTAGGIVAASMVLWFGCSPERNYHRGGAGGAGGLVGNAGAGGKAGAAGKAGTSGRSASAGGSSTAGNAATVGEAGTDFSGGGSSGEGGSGGAANDGGSSNPSAGAGGEAGQAVAPECALDQSEACGECGTRTCDPTTLTWGDCIGDGHQESCWETEDGVALPGRMPSDPKGNCVVGNKTCDPVGQWQACLGAVAPEAADKCDTPGDDADCNGMVNEGCTCQENETRGCGIDTGNCQSGMQTCKNLMWGACVGEIKAQAQDSCAVAGDDANCNGVNNDSCACTEDVPATCADSFNCTADSCQNGNCSNQINSGFCLIGATCVPQGQADPTNPCRRCDTTVSKTGWTNSSSSTGCDDGLYCNGTDTCNGSGTCTHQFTGNRCTGTGPCDASTCDETRDSCFKPNATSCDDGLYCNGTDTCNASGTCTHQFTGNRCTGTGPCDSPTCDETRDSCFRPSSYVCGTTTEYQCTSSSCGGDLQSRASTQNCSGTASACNGVANPPPAFTTSSDCGTDTVCNATGHSCNPKLGCGTTWCDSTANLCWTTGDAPQRVSRVDAQNYCAGLNLGGKSSGWRLPTIQDWLNGSRACDGTTGTAKAASFDSTCYLDTANNVPADCTSCPDHGGPAAADGCYWQAGMGTCPSGSDTSYWTDTPYDSFEVWFYSPTSVFVYSINPGSTLLVRCVHDP